MLGTSENCTPVESNNICEDINCKHSSDIKQLYSVMGLYDNTPIETIIDCILQQQSDFLNEMCNSTLLLEAVAKVTGFSGCVYPVVDKGCISFCGNQRRWYTFDLCKACEYTSFTNDFYVTILKLYKTNKYPSRGNIKKAFSLFGWNTFYDSENIIVDIGIDSPLMVGVVLNLVPMPLGVTVKILAEC